MDSLYTCEICGVFYALTAKYRKKTVCKPCNHRIYRTKVKKQAVEYKGGKCAKCGYSKALSALQFHHVDPSQKEFDITRNTRCFERLKPELDKTVLLCSNCHAEIHAKMHSPILID